MTNFYHLKELAMIQYLWVSIPHLKSINVDTLITGELRQHHYNMAQELELNLFPCGHYATETFGVKSLAEEIANYFKIEWVFLNQDCTL